MFTVYKITNTETNEVEHVGQTQDTETRWIKHTMRKPGTTPNGEGKFYQRTDVIMEPISEHRTRGEAKEHEKRWQIHYDCEDGCGYVRRKLTKEEVRYIRSSDKTQRVLADELGVSNPTICKVRTHQTYKII